MNKPLDLVARQTAQDDNSGSLVSAFARPAFLSGAFVVAALAAGAGYLAGTSLAPSRPAPLPRPHAAVAATPALTIGDRLRVDRAFPPLKLPPRVVVAQATRAPVTSPPVYHAPVYRPPVHHVAPTGGSGGGGAG